MRTQDSLVSLSKFPLACGRPRFENKSLSEPMTFLACQKSSLSKGPSVLDGWMDGWMAGYVPLEVALPRPQVCGRNKAGDSVKWGWVESAAVLARCL